MGRRDQDKAVCLPQPSGPSFSQSLHGGGGGGCGALALYPAIVVLTPHLKERVVPVPLVSTFLGREVKDRLVLGQPEI